MTRHDYVGFVHFANFVLVDTKYLNHLTIQHLNCLNIMYILKESAIATCRTHSLINTINTISLCSTRSRSLDCTRNKLCRHENGARLARGVSPRWMRTGQSSNQNSVKPALMTSKSSMVWQQSFWLIYGTTWWRPIYVCSLPFPTNLTRVWQVLGGPPFSLGVPKKFEAACLETHKERRELFLNYL
jgi:hypothetical protein